MCSLNCMHTFLRDSYGCLAVSSSIGVLLPELVVSIVLLLTIDAGLMQETGSIPLLAGLLEHLDRFNHLAPGHERDDMIPIESEGERKSSCVCAKQQDRVFS